MGLPRWVGSRVMASCALQFVPSRYQVVNCGKRLVRRVIIDMCTVCRCLTWALAPLQDTGVASMVTWRAYSPTAGATYPTPGGFGRRPQLQGPGRATPG